MIVTHANTICAVGENGRVISGTVDYHFHHRTIVATVVIDGDDHRFILPPVHRMYDEYYYAALDTADNHEDKNGVLSWTDDFGDAGLARYHEFDTVIAMYDSAIELLRSKGPEAIANESASFDSLIATELDYASMLWALQCALCDIIVEDIQRAAFMMIVEKALELRRKGPFHTAA